MCECITQMDKLLEPSNTRLSPTMIFVSNVLSVVPTIMTEQIKTGRGLPKAVQAVPTYCPFCGEKYDVEVNDE